MTNQITTFDSGIKCMPSEEITVGLEHTLVQSSADILTELFGSLNAKLPVSLDNIDNLVKKSNKHHKKNKKHRHSSHKRKTKSKKSKRNKKMSSAVPVPEVCRLTPLPNEVSDKDNSRPISVSSDVCIDMKSSCMPSCAEDDCIIIQNVDTIEPFPNNHAEIEIIQPEKNLGLDLKLDKSVPGKSQKGVAINASSAWPTTEVQVGLGLIDINMDVETRPNETLIKKENLNNTIEIVKPTTVLTSVLSCDGDTETKNTQHLSTEVVSKMIIERISKSKSREPSHSPTKKLKRSKECTPEKGGHKQTSKRLQDRNRSNSPDLDHHNKKNIKGGMAKDDSHSNRQKRSRSQNLDHESKDQKKRSKGLGKKVRGDDQKKNRSSSRERKLPAVSKKRRSRSCDEFVHVEVNHNKRRERGKRTKSRTRSRSRDKRKRSISQDISSDRKNAKTRQRRSVSKDKTIRRKGRDRSSSRGHKRSISRDRSTDRKRKSTSRNRSTDRKKKSTSRNRSTDRKRKSLSRNRSADRKRKSLSRNRSADRKRKSLSRNRSTDGKRKSLSRNRSTDRKRKSISQNRSTDRKRKSLSRNRSTDRKRKSTSLNRSTDRKKSTSRNRSVENKIQSVSRERSTSKSKVKSRSKSHDGDSHTEQVESATENPSRVEQSRSRSRDVGNHTSDRRSTSLSVDTVEPQGEQHKEEDSLQTDRKGSLSKDVDSCQSTRKHKSKNRDVDKCKTDKKKNNRSNQKSRSKSPVKESRQRDRKSHSKSPVKDSRQRDRKRRSKSTDSSSPQKRSKRKSRSRSRSHNKDSKKTDLRRRRSKSKDVDVGRKNRRSQSKSRHSHKVDRTKKSKSKDREDRSKNKPRSKSKDIESRNISRKSRSRSRDKDKSSHRTDKRSRSRSMDRSHRIARKRRSRSREVHIDKRKLFEIARKNAMTMLKQAAAPFGAENLVAIKYFPQAGGKSVEELTDFCKQLSKKETGASSDSGEEDQDAHHSDSDVERPFHHPFQLKERPANIVLNIRNSVSVPTKTFQEKTAEQSKQLRLQFPVSSGQNHRKTESEWVPVASGQPSTSVQPSSSTSQPSQSTSAAVPSPVLDAVQSDSPSSSSVFPRDTASPPDIGNIVEKRVNAMRKLTANPNDSHAISQIYQVNQQMSMWLASKQQPGQFTGSTGAKVLTAAELSTGYQAWAKKDQLMSAAPVSGGMGMALLQKMGWRPGEGLGKNKEGTLEPLKLEVKTDKRGLVAQDEVSSKHQNSSRPHQRTTTLAGKHPVSLLVEFCSKRHWDSPQFHVCFECGPDHKKNFLFKVRVNGTEYQPSVASNNKKQAKAEAARLCLQTLGLLYPDPPK